MSAGIALMLVIGVLAFRPLSAHAAQPSVDLGTAASYAVLAGAGVTNTNGTVINGNLGTHPTPAVTGFPPGLVHGVMHKADAPALQAKSDLVQAYNDAAGRTPVTRIATELGGQRLKPGVYDSASGTFHITGTLTLDAKGNPNGVFIFQMATTLVTSSGSNVSLLGSAQACNNWWQVGSSATLGTNSDFTGNIMALASIQVKSGVTVHGRVLARTASVTLDNDTITRSTCAATPTGPGSPGPGGSNGPGNTNGPGTNGPGTNGPGTNGPGGSTPTGPSTPQVGIVPPGGPQTGGGSTAGEKNVGLFLLGGMLLAAAAGTFALRRRAFRHV